MRPKGEDSDAPPCPHARMRVRSGARSTPDRKAESNQWGLADTASAAHPATVREEGGGGWGLSSRKGRPGRVGAKNGFAAARPYSDPAISHFKHWASRIFGLAGKSFGNRQVLIFWRPEISFNRWRKAARTQHSIISILGPRFGRPGACACIRSWRAVGFLPAPHSSG
jgi:hypothetical protein